MRNCRSCPCCCCRSNNYDLDSARSKQIDRDLERERRLLKRQVRVLLLGAGESGKSTFIKQIRIIHGVEFTEEDLLGFRHNIYMNVVQGIRVLADARSKLSLPLQAANQPHSDLLLATNPSQLDEIKFSELTAPISRLWADSSIKSVFHSKRSMLQISDSVEWFLDELERISGKDYIPSTKDILLLRRATKGLHQLQLNINNVPFTFYDVGGQRTQRSKWVECFSNVGLTSLIYMTAASEWDQVLAEDRTTNRLRESVNIFSLLVNSRVFDQVSFILFLNKYDLLLKKVQSSSESLHLHFPEYGAAVATMPELDRVKQFILQLFTSQNRVGKRLYYHWTTAVDTEQIRLIFNVVRETILKRNLGQLMLE